MKTLKKYIKPISLLFIVILIFQGCIVYKSKPVTLDKAVKANTQVKIKTKNNKTIKFKKIVFEEGSYYGVNNFYKDDPFDVSKKVEIKTPIEVNIIESVKVKNKSMSTILPFATPIILLGIVVIGYTAPAW